MVHTLSVPASQTSLLGGLFPCRRTSIMPGVLDSAQKGSKEQRRCFARSIHSIASLRSGDILKLAVDTNACVTVVMPSRPSRKRGRKPTDAALVKFSALSLIDRPASMISVVYTRVQQLTAHIVNNAVVPTALLVCQPRQQNRRVDMSVDPSSQKHAMSCKSQKCRSIVSPVPEAFKLSATSGLLRASPLCHFRVTQAPFTVACLGPE